MAEKRLIEFVGERRCHLAHRAQTRHVNQLGLQFLQSCLSLLMLRKIANKSREIGLSTRLHFADGQMHRERGAILAHAGDDPPDADDAPFAGGFR